VLGLSDPHPAIACSGRVLQEMPNVELVGLAHLDRSPKYIRDSLNLPWLAQYPKTLEGYAETSGA